MRFLLLSLLIIALLCYSCSDSSEKPVTENETTEKSFDYSSYTSHTLKKLHLNIKFPNTVTPTPFSQARLDSVVELSKSINANPQLIKMAGFLYDHKKGKVEVFGSEAPHREIIISKFQRLTLDAATVKQMVAGMQMEIDEMNKIPGVDYKLADHYQGRSGKIAYAVFKTTSEMTGDNTIAVVTLGTRSWLLNFFGEQDLDLTPILESISFPTK